MASSAVSASLSLAGAQLPGEEKKGKTPLQKLFILLSFVLAAATAAFGIIAMALQQTTIVYVAFAIGVADSVYVSVQRYQLINLESLREVMNKLREEINRLALINNDLTAQNDELRLQVDKLKEIEEGLSNIVTKQGQSVESFVVAVKENQQTLDGMKELLKAKILQDLVTIVLRADRNRDGKIGPNEINMMLTFLKNAQGVMLDEEKFLAKMKKQGNSLQAVLAICRKMVYYDTKDEKIIDVDPKKVHLSDMDNLGGSKVYAP